MSDSPEFLTALSKECINKILFSFYCRKCNILLNHNTSEQKKVSMDLYKYLKTPGGLLFELTWLLSSPAMVEGSWLDLARRNKPETQPFAHLTINAIDIPSGKFHLYPA